MSESLSSPHSKALSVSAVRIGSLMLHSLNYAQMQNATSSISVKGLVFRRIEGVHHQLPATLSRRSFPIDLVDTYPHPDIEPFIATRSQESYLPNGPPARRPSKLPPPGRLNLSFHLGEALGSGRSGIVYDIADAQVFSESRRFVCHFPASGGEDRSAEALPVDRP